MASSRSAADLAEFVLRRTAPAPVPLVPEIQLYQATEMTPLWRATAAELEGWVDSPFWAFPWAGGQALARHVLDNAGLVRGKRVLDFASGSGLVAIAAARAGAASVVAVDVDPFSAVVIPMNAALNRVAVTVRAGDLIGELLPGFDLVLAGDVFYERALAERGFPWFQALAGRGVRVLAGDPGRTYTPRGGTRDLADYTVPSSTEIEARAELHTWVVEVEP